MFCLFCFILRVYVRLLIFSSFYVFVSECLYYCAATLWLFTVSAYTSLLRVSYSFSIWISVLVFGYIVTHWTCICTSLDPCFSLSSLWMPLPVFGKIVTDCPCIVSFLDLHFYLCFSLSVSVSAYITAKSACICTSFYGCFSLTFCLSMCIPVAECINIHSWCICTSLNPCFSLSFYVIVYICVRLYCHWLYVYIGTSLIPRFCLSSLCLSQCPGILLTICMYLSKRVQVAQCVIEL